MRGEDKRREPREKIPQRCDPADSRPVAAYTGAEPRLSVDDRVRAVVQEQIRRNTPRPAEPSLDELNMLEGLDEDDLILSPHQAVLMETDDPVELDAARFIEQLGPEKMAELREALRAVDAAEEAVKKGAAGEEAAGDAVGT